MESEKIIPLNIVTTYPVKWTKYQVLRDFVQNFYDEINHDSWQENFKHEYNKQTGILTMEITNDGFSYEWLLHIGASTKSETENKFAGFYGEGFKIAALCALRDYSWNAKMQSRKWALEVCTVDDIIDGHKVKMMAYKIVTKEYLGGSRLTLSNISEEDYALFLVVLDSFYYPKNRMFSKCIWENECCAVYERSDQAIDKRLPHTYKLGSAGAVFCSYQMLGTNPFPLAFCLHDYETSDRERNALHEFEVNEVILKIATLLSPKAAVYVLEKMQIYWNTYPVKKRKIEVTGWSPIINALIRRIRLSKKVTQQFRKSYPNLLCANKVFTVQEKNRRNQAMAWAKSTDVKFRIVKNTFCLLDYPFLEDECDKHGGFVDPRMELKEIEEKCTDILEELTDIVFSDFFDLESDWPRIYIINNNSASYDGMAFVTKKIEPIENCKGLKIKYTISRIHMKEKLFNLDAFGEALSVYIHELCHMFGGDSSSNFSRALTIAMEMLFARPDLLDEMRNRWTEAFKNVVEKVDDER